MGTCSSAPQSTQRNNEINQILLKDKKALARTIQVLLLGAGESGKSTFLKQMRILFKNGIPNHEIPFFRKTIHSNILVAIYSLCVAASDLGFSLLPENQLRAVFFSELITEEGADYVFDQEMGEDISALWDDPSIQLAFAESHRFQLSDSTTYFMEKLASISSPDYVPSLDDILHSRSKTVGICETGFDVQGTHFKMIDVGGQRSERSKWIYCFEGVGAIIYFVALSEYNLALQEDASVNRMNESLKIFHQVSNAKWFLNTPIILFLNKSDIFRKKIAQPQHSLSHTFVDYKGEGFEEGVELIRRKFLGMADDIGRIYTHVTCCTDTEQIKFVFSSVKDFLLSQLLTEFEIPH